MKENKEELKTKQVKETFPFNIINGIRNAIGLSIIKIPVIIMVIMGLIALCTFLITLILSLLLMFVGFMILPINAKKSFIRMMDGLENSN